MPMIDRFNTDDKKIVKRACAAMMARGLFECEVFRPECAPEYQHQKWRGHVLKIERVAAGFEIEVQRFDTP